VTPETAECGVLDRREELRRERTASLARRSALGAESEVSGEPLEPVGGQVCIPVEPEQLRVALARPGDPVLRRLGAEFGLQDAQAVGRYGFEEVVQSRMRAMSSSRRSTRCAVPARRTS
jgi:hypothetical protein